MAIDTDKLENCPFCGGNAIVVNEDRSWIECADCPSKAVCGPFDTEAEAIRAWNTRACPTLPASDEVREKVALALVNYDCAQTDCPALSSVEEFRFDADRDEYLGRADAALSAIPADPVVEVRKFDLGDRVTKTKGSSWTGHVVGFYSTSLTKVGYAVESENEPGSVQIYPEGALAAYRGK